MKNRMKQRLYLICMFYAVDVMGIVGLHVNENQILVRGLCESLVIFINRMISENKNLHEKVKGNSIVTALGSFLRCNDFFFPFLDLEKN